MVALSMLNLQVLPSLGSERGLSRYGIYEKPAAQPMALHTKTLGRQSSMHSMSSGASSPSAYTIRRNRRRLDTNNAAQQHEGPELRQDGRSAQHPTAVAVAYNVELGDVRRDSPP